MNIGIVRVESRDKTLTPVVPHHVRDTLEPEGATYPPLDQNQSTTRAFENTRRCRGSGRHARGARRDTIGECATRAHNRVDTSARKHMC